MNKEAKRKTNFKCIGLIIVGLIIILGIAFGYLLYKEKLKKHFDNLYNQNRILTVNYGIVNKEKKLMEKNTLFKKIDQDNKYYLIITEDKTLFTYYLDWYYFFDPLKGYIIDNEIQLTDSQEKNIIDKINQKKVPNLVAKNELEYIEICLNNTTSYITKNDMLLILESQNINITI